MAKIGLYADPHVSQSSSIIIGHDGEYSTRLSSLIRTFSWMDEVFKSHDCESIICLGDFTDKPILTSEEISAISEFKNIRTHHFLVGNHCRSSSDGSVNTLNLFEKVYYSPEVVEVDGCRILLLPYSKYPIDLSEFKDIKVVLSHNDIKDYSLGVGIFSTTGYRTVDILENCKLFINGHLHNGGWLLQSRILNLGQVSGMNFSSCGGQWNPAVGILDTQDLSVEIIENPYACIFKKYTVKSLLELKDILEGLSSTTINAIQIKLPEELSDSARKLLEQYPKIFARILIIPTNKAGIKEVMPNNYVEGQNIYTKLRNFIREQENERLDFEVLNRIIDEIENQSDKDTLNETRI